VQLSIEGVEALSSKKKIIACDLGTGGNKASLYTEDGRCVAKTFVPYKTYYPAAGFHEQRPADWWDAVVESMARLMRDAGDRNDIECIVFSGHSLGAVPIDKNGNLLRELTPIWSDTRAEIQAADYFGRTDERTWYMTTGNGFPPPCYTVFKVMWYCDNEPDMFSRTYKILGTKDFINYRLTGTIQTDYSYASGSGVYDLKKWDYSPGLLDTSGLAPNLFPEIVPSTQVIGGLTQEASQKLGLPRKVKVVCGGVDNSCMALGARNIEEGRVYTSLGSSAWIAVSSTKPVLDPATRPFVFTHVIPEMFTSAVSVFSAGSSLNWVLDNLFSDLRREARETGRDVYELFNELAAKAPAGAHKLIFNPSLAGGTSQDPSVHIRGAYTGIDLGHTPADLARSCMEGIAINLGLVLDILRGYTKLSDEMMLVGGGSRSRLWRQIFADVYRMKIVRTNIGQEAGSLGAAAVGAVGCGLWDDFSRIDAVHTLQEVVKPIQENVEVYKKLKPAFEHVRKCQAEIGDMLYDLEI